MKVTVIVSDKRAVEGTSNRGFCSYCSAYNYIKSHLDKALAVVIKYENAYYIRTISEFISFMEMEEIP